MQNIFKIGISLLIVAFAIIQTSYFIGAIYVGQALKAAEQHNITLTYNKLSTAISLAPRTTTYLSLRGRIFKQPNDIRKAIQINPFYYRHYLDLSTSVEDPSISQLYLHEASKLIPNSYPIYNALAINSYKQGKSNDVLRYANHAIKLTNNNSSSAYSYYIIGKAYQKKHDDKSAFESFITSLLKKPLWQGCLNNIDELSQYNNLKISIDIQHKLQEATSLCLKQYG
jgi:tetratricopeptide (TPR) repeat protein